MSEHKGKLSNEVSMEEYQHMVSSGQVSKNDAGVGKKHLVLGLVIIGVAVVGFMAGTGYQKSKQPEQNQTSLQQPGAMESGQGMQMMGPGAGGGRMMMRLGATGDVTVVSDSSITIKNDRTGEAETFTITTDTKIYNGRDAVTAGSIQVGDKVTVKGMTDDKTIAASIAITTSVITDTEAVDNSNANSL